jgi:hypothetical protein
MYVEHLTHDPVHLKLNATAKSLQKAIAFLKKRYQDLVVWQYLSWNQGTSLQVRIDIYRVLYVLF